MSLYDESIGGLIGASYGFYSYGTRLVNVNAYTRFSWAPFQSAITQEVGFDKSLTGVLQSAGIKVNENSGIAPGSIQGVKGTIRVNNFNGADGLGGGMQRGVVL